ncbi:hypothetical protein [Haloterrigena alkaliphila]|uniref:Uncharacterized protein n=1 Tax=Haloterrigena alkaliphila TaxID=2816475 RepID=A0A8A2VE43_9EURY|nr:hypothetical protein [Haloterrigena alkaliphila]QSW99526.1 hypothetical protein J0X25_00790 [Haloterrigena alkaliphila]
MCAVLLLVDDEESRARAQAAAVRDLPAADEEIHVDLLHVHEDAAGDEEPE